MPSEPRRIREPIILLGFARSGTTMLARLFRAHPDVAVMEEPRTIWSIGHAYGRDERLGAEDLTPRIARRIDARFAAFLARSGARRFAEKTPSNCLRVPFVHALYPDCRIIHILRHGSAVVRSLLQETSRPPQARRILYRLRQTRLADLPAQLPLLVEHVWRTRVLRQHASFWGPRPPGWRAWRNLSPHVRVARQWRVCVETALRHGRELPAQNYLELRYERFVQQPEETARELLAFAGLPVHPDFLAHARQRIDPRRGERWQGSLTEAEEAETRAEMEPLLSQLYADSDAAQERGL